MSKRFTDTDKWQKKWFMKLTPAEKSAWFYITENCDNVGVWDPNFELANFIIGAEVEWDKFLNKVNGNIKVLHNGKWWLVDFCSFQHPDLNPKSNSKPIQSYIKLLKKHGLFEEVTKGYTKGMDNLSKGYKVKDKEREKVEEKAGHILNYYKKLTGKSRVANIPKQLTARLKEDFTKEECIKVILYKYLQWWDNEKMRDSVNLVTLFRPSHFEEYLAQAEKGLDILLKQKYEEYAHSMFEKYKDIPKAERIKMGVKILDYKEWREGYINGTKTEI